MFLCQLLFSAPVILLIRFLRDFGDYEILTGSQQQPLVIRRCRGEMGGGAAAGVSKVVPG